MNFHTLPNLANCLAIFGCGDAAELLTTVQWLAECKVLYWGDIDEHGFHILARLRSKVPGVKSIMMDKETLNQFLSLTGEGNRAGNSPKNLTPGENEAYMEVQTRNLRLEQEKIPHDYSNSILILNHVGLGVNGRSVSASQPRLVRPVALG